MAFKKVKKHKNASRLFIIDDHPLVRIGFSFLISRYPDLKVCGEASNPTDALTMVEKTNPHLVIMDISLEGGSNFELIKQLLSIDPNLRVLVMSAYEESLYTERALQAGAMGFINKTEPLENLVDAIQQLLKGNIYLKADFAPLLTESSSKAEASQSFIDQLSDRELEVFELIGNGLTSGEIANQLKLSVKTIETHFQNIKQKINARTSHDLIQRAAIWINDQQNV